MKKLIISLILISSAFIWAEKSQLARLHYQGGGDWYNDQDILPNIAIRLNEDLKTDFAPSEAVVKLTDSNIFNYPFLFMTGHGNISFNAKEVENLRKYLNRGGFLYVDDDYGLDESFRREIKKVFPDFELIELPVEHDIFHCFYESSNGIPKIHEHDGKRPQAFAIFNPTGRMLVFYTYETNITDGWSDVHSNQLEIKEQAFQMGVNLFYYLMTN